MATGIAVDRSATARLHQSWSSLYDEANLVTHITQVWRDDGVPANIPLFITESNIAWQSEEAYVDIWGALWLADYIASARMYSWSPSP